MSDSLERGFSPSEDHDNLAARHQESAKTHEGGILGID